MAKGASAVLGSAFLFALLPVFLRLAYATNADPYCLMATRTAIAALATAMLCRLTGRNILPDRAALGPIMLACATYSAMSLCFNLACSEIEAGPANALFHLSPVLVMASAVAMGRFLPERRSVCAGALAIFSCILLLESFEESLSAPGIALSLGAAAFSAAYTLTVASPKLESTDPLALTFYVCVASCCTSLGTGLAAQSSLASLSPQALLWALMAALLSTAAAMSLFIYGTRRVGPVASSVLGNAEVLFTPLVSGVLLQESTSIIAAVGYMAIAAACVLASLPTKRRPSI